MKVKKPFNYHRILQALTITNQNIANRTYPMKIHQDGHSQLIITSLGTKKNIPI